MVFIIKIEFEDSVMLYKKQIIHYIIRFCLRGMSYLHLMNKTRTINKFFQFKEKHHFHLVDQSQLPILTAFAVMLLVLNIVFYLHSTEVSYIRFLDDLMFHSA